MNKQAMSICLWFDTQAEEAVSLYSSVFRNFEMGSIARYGKEGFEIHGKPEGTVMTATFHINGMKFMALNGGPQFKFNESISIVVTCETQEEIDHYWNQLTANGGEEGPCGWLKDKFGVSWQIVPAILDEYFSKGNAMQVQQVTKAFLQMKKFDIEKLTEAYNS
jgi:predicted 3-demethylubiquinone-9 3-methyltransferase (glyoxalase superfamily)